MRGYGRILGSDIQSLCAMSELDKMHLKLLRCGDAAAWCAFVSAAGPLLKGVILRVLYRAGRADECADVLQEVFLRLVRDDFRLLRRYDPQRARLGTWLRVVASSTAIDWLRKSPSADETLDRLPEHHLAVDDPPLREAPAIPADALTPRQALILKLIYEDDLAVAEVAALLGIKAQTVRSLRHKALTRLRHVCKGERG